MDGYCDDPTIQDAAALWRRIPPCHFVPDDNLGTVRPSSAAFEDTKKPSYSPMSVLLASVMSDTKRGPEDALTGHAGFALASITAGLARRCHQGVARDPEPDEPAHAIVFGTKTKSIRRTLAKASEWVIPPVDRLAQ